MKYKPFLKWWLLFVLITIGTTSLFMFGAINLIIIYDISKISFLIYGIFAVLTMKIGKATYKSCKYGEEYNTEYDWFFSDALTRLGLIGTVIGIMFTLYMTFIAVDIQNVAALGMVIPKMAIGMGTALVTTFFGMCCDLLLKLQLLNLEHSYENKKKIK